MATTFADDMPARRWRRGAVVEQAESIGDLPFKLVVTVICLFAFRDMTTSSIRYYLSLARLSPAWFIPDLLSLGIFFYFAWHFAWIQRSPFAILLTCSAVVSTVIGMLFMQSTAFALISSIKLFLPFFAGAILAGRSLTELRSVRWLLTATFLMSIVGLLLSPYVDYPWLGQTLNNFGADKQVGKIWWANGEVRYGGLAGESTMAAYMCVIPFIVLHRRFSLWQNLALWIPLYIAVDISTSKTAMLTLIAFCAIYLVTIIRPRRELAFTKSIAKLSYLTIPLPFILMILMGGIDLTQISPTLFSMQDRISRTWVFPFIWLSENHPLMLLSGCGLGCFTYPMEYTGLAELMVPVDNFYVATYVMMGLPFLIFVIGTFVGVTRSVSVEKLILLTVLNLYAVTVQCYGPSTATLFLGYAFSDTFLRGHGWQRLLSRRGRDASSTVPPMQSRPSRT